MSWGELLKYRTTWGLIIGNGGYLYMVFVFVTWLPGYLVLQRHMSMLRGSFVGMLTFVVAFGATIAGGWLSDRIAKHTRITVARKTMTCGGLFTATIFTLLAAYTAGLWLAITFLILTVASYSLATGSLNAMPVDVAPPKYVSSLAALMNVGGNIGGALAPMVTGILLARTGSFQIPLLVAAGITLIFGCGFFGLVVGSLETRLGETAAVKTSI
jgi:MFS family permease